MAERFKPHLTIALIIEYEGRFLMVEEFQDTGERCFGIPAGHVDAKESILEAAVREGLEETGCAIELEHLVGIYDYVKEKDTIIRFTFKARLKDNDPTKAHPADPDGDILAVHWMTREEINNRKSQWRTRLVGSSFDDYDKGQNFPLSLITTVRG